MNNNLFNQIFEISAKKAFRTIFLVTGNNSLQQIAKIHYSWSKISSQHKSQLLWVYSNHNTLVSLKNNKRNLILNQFYQNSKIRYLYYKDSKKILGNSFGICIFQDLRDVSPNNFLRIIETVEGGGVIILLSEQSTSHEIINRKIINLNNIIPEKNFQKFLGRFMTNFLFSLESCPVFFLLDSDFLTIELFKNKILFLKNNIQNNEINKKNLYLRLINSISNVHPINELIKKTKTFDQARAFLSLTESIADKNKYSRIIITSGRGRGKSSVLGLACCSAVAYGFSNIFITSNNVENINSFYAFLILGLETLGLKENKEFEIIYNNKKKTIQKINIFSTHRQFIKYISPEEIDDKKDFIEILIIEEAATFQYEILKRFIGPYITIFSTTSGGYEGSGRSFNLKFVDWIKKESNQEKNIKNGEKIIYYKEIILTEPIRYSCDDYLEKWVNEYFFFSDSYLKTFNFCPDPLSCKLYMIDRNCLFSNHKISRKILQKIINIFFFSHYKNSPDDLQLMCDSPFHRILVLIHQKDITLSLIPDILAAVQISYEGQIAKNYSAIKFDNEMYYNGDLIPWVISKSYFDFNFTELSSIRIVRIGVHGSIQNLGFGSKVIEKIEDFCYNKSDKYSNEYSFFKKKIDENMFEKCPPLFIDINLRTSPQIDYIGVSFNLSPQLFFFWNKNEFRTILIKKNKKNFLAKFSCIMIKIHNINKNIPMWFLNIQKKFLRNFINLLDSEYRDLDLKVILYLINGIFSFNIIAKSKNYSKNKFLSNHDIKLIKLYTIKKNFDFTYIRFIFGKISKALLFENFLDYKLKNSEILVLIGLGMQRKSIKNLLFELEMKKEHIFALINNILKKFEIYAIN